jgi:O-acetyl-ADP-ribose deacetylase (regulator of RNase III)
VIHTVGPVWQGGNHGEAALLSSCYRNSLDLAREYQCETLAFPAISTGVYGFPKQEAAEIALRTVLAYRETDHPFMQITFCCFSPEDLQRYEALLARLRL